MQPSNTCNRFLFLLLFYVFHSPFAIKPTTLDTMLYLHSIEKLMRNSTYAVKTKVIAY